MREYTYLDLNIVENRLKVYKTMLELMQIKYKNNVEIGLCYYIFKATKELGYFSSYIYYFKEFNNIFTLRRKLSNLDLDFMIKWNHLHYWWTRDAKGKKKRIKVVKKAIKICEELIKK